jgi:ElaB/YqjD/DUF883 family membrane-anchored ribosome-binding protein
MSKNGGDASPDIEALIGSVREDIAKLTDAMSQAFATRGAEAGAAAREGLEEAWARGRSAAGRLRSEAGEAAESLEHAIEERPIVAVLIALVLGFLAGSLLRR